MLMSKEKLQLSLDLAWKRHMTGYLSASSPVVDAKILFIRDGEPYPESEECKGRRCFIGGGMNIFQK